VKTLQGALYTLVNLVVDEARSVQEFLQLLAEDRQWGRCLNGYWQLVKQQLWVHSHVRFTVQWTPTCAGQIMEVYDDMMLVLGTMSAW